MLALIAFVLYMSYSAQQANFLIAHNTKTYQTLRLDKIKAKYETELKNKRSTNNTQKNLREQYYKIGSEQTSKSEKLTIAERTQKLISRHIMCACQNWTTFATYFANLVR